MDSEFLFGALALVLLVYAMYALSIYGDKKSVQKRLQKTELEFRVGYWGETYHAWHGEFFYSNALCRGYLANVCHDELKGGEMVRATPENFDTQIGLWCLNAKRVDPPQDNLTAKLLQHNRGHDWLAYVANPHGIVVLQHVNNSVSGESGPKAGDKVKVVYNDRGELSIRLS